MVYCITYDLNGDEKDYEGVAQAIENAVILVNLHGSLSRA